MAVVTLPPPSSYRQPVPLRSSWNEDMHDTSKRKSSYSCSSIRMVDYHTHSRPQTFATAYTHRRKPSLGLAPRKESAKLVTFDERQNVCSRNASLTSASDSSCYGVNTVPDRVPHVAKRRQIKVQLPSTEVSDSIASGQRTNPKGPKMLNSHTRSVSAFPVLETDCRSNTASSRPLTPEPIRSASSMSPPSTSTSNGSKSSIDLRHVPYSQTVPASLRLDNHKFMDSIRRNADRLTRQKTLEMYRANVKKTTEPEVQYLFAVLLIEIAQELNRTGATDAGSSTTELLLEARQILQRLADRSYPFAQYYLADGYVSGFFNNKAKPEYDKAFPLFIAASKRGHGEAGYRAGLCYEFGWGTRSDPAKAIQFYRQSASKNHPGGMARLARACLSGDLGGGIQYREGVKWLKRAAESADKQYNTAPYDLGCLHETGYGDDVFKDESYAAQLFTQAAGLDNADAAFKLGQAYESGKLSCPKDPALSIHFYATAASQGHAQAMFALCAWYMVGADPILEKDEIKAYEWAKKAAHLGHAKAQYTVAYFAEVGIAGPGESLEANEGYIKAVERCEDNAMERVEAKRKAASSRPQIKSIPTSRSNTKVVDDRPQKKWKLFGTAN